MSVLYERIAVLIITVVCLLTSASAQQKQLDFCNKTFREISFAIVYTPSDQAVNAISEGWWSLAPGECRQITKPFTAHARMWLHGEYSIEGDGDRGQSRDGLRMFEGPSYFCVDSGFIFDDFEIQFGEPCSSQRNFKTVGFLELDVKSTLPFTYIFDCNPNEKDCPKNPYGPKSGIIAPSFWRRPSPPSTSTVTSTNPKSNTIPPPITIDAIPKITVSCVLSLNNVNFAWSDGVAGAFYDWQGQPIRQYINREVEFSPEPFRNCSGVVTGAQVLGTTRILVTRTELCTNLINGHKSTYINATCPR